MKPGAIATTALVTFIALGGGAWFYVDQRIRSEVDARLAAAVESG